MSKKIAVIGLGNPLRGDDGIGTIILTSLLSDYKRDHIDYLDFGSASFDLINRLKNYELCLIIDAISAGLFPGELKIFCLHEAVFENSEGIISTHELSLKDIFELSKKFDIKTKIYVAGVQIKEVGFGKPLCLDLKNKLNDLTLEIDRFIGEKLK